ncbi:50S ribosomal protein L16 [Candidatus Cerribacteria bacterium 'Amazon FNV 2010 28 9']|uniref:Large ribosomal subunit protein uL16 n=1 Tax=Candidatus Cerribacteria bacterium 'Amazon FNV 2010 28 9' TaxID=2081795 RepID=A0A317JQX7_9BACT|nr:MAG: 50S ribosomal protein L16 [Candidatus Cerribacteria bacterium 'Amazon FNV 2010 28 9']
MLQPKKMKYRKMFKGKRAGLSLRANSLDFGEFGLKAVECGWFTSRQIEAARRTITHHTKRAGKMWIRIFPDKPTTQKAAGVKMGGGKGDIKEYVAVVRPGRVLFEIGGVSEEMAREAFRKAAYKIPMKTVFVTKE